MIEELDFAEIDVLLDQLASAHRRGEKIALPPDVAADPKLAKRVQQLLNTMLQMEGLATPFPGIRSKTKRFHAHIEQVGDYRIIREIGRGGMGVVYEAEQPALRRRVALKVLPDFAIADPVAVERFQREARAVARLHHTNIVPVFEVGREGERRFFAMQLISGCGLDRLIHVRKSRSSKIEGVPSTATLAQLQNEEIRVVRKRGNTPPRTRFFADPDSPSSIESRSDLSIDGTTEIVVAPDWLRSSGRDYIRSVAKAGVQAAAALEHAHSRGVIHRDIKPSNLLMDESGTIWVTDFGLAKTEDEDLTRSNAILGTVRYMAPERIRGKGDARSDIYSLGVTLYEMAALRAAHDALDQVELLAAVAKSEPPRLRSLDASIPKDFETVILKAIEKDPQRRYQSAGELAADLERFLADEPVHARRATISDRLARWCRKNPVIAGMTATIATLLIGFATYIVASNRRLTNELDRSVILQRAETRAKNEATDRLVDSQIERARAIRRSPNIGRRFESLQAIREAAELRLDPRLRDEAIASLAHFDIERLGQPLELSDPPGSTTFASGFDSKLERCAILNQSGLSVCRFSDRKVLQSFPHGTDESFWNANSRFSPSDRYVVAGYGLYGEGLTSTVWDLTKNARVFVGRGVEVYWLPNDQLLCKDRATGKVKIVDPATGVGTPTPLVVANPFSPLPAPDGKSVAIWSPYDGNVIVKRVADAAEIGNFPHDSNVTSVGWSPDGKLLVVALRSFDCIVWNFAARRRQTTLVGHLGGPQVIEFHPSGSFVATSVWGQTTKFWNPLDGRPLLSIDPGLSRFSADGGKFVAREGNVATTWSMAIGDIQAPLNLAPASTNFGGPTAECVHLDFSPDESLLACAQPTGVRIFECRNFAEVALVPCGKIKGVMFDARGENLYTFGPGSSHRWPIVVNRLATGARFRIGPPTRVEHADAGTLDRFKASGDRKTIVVPQTWVHAAVAFDLDRPSERKYFGPVDRIRNLAISPDKRWIAAGGWKSGVFKVWEASTGKQVASLNCNQSFGEPGSAEFSVDGRYLLTQSEDLIFWDTKTWKRAEDRPTIATTHRDIAPAFTPDGRLLAVAISPEEIQLFDAASMTKLASLTSPGPVGLQTLTFSSGGRFLATGTVDHKVFIWKLAELRRRLDGLGLNWSDSVGDEMKASISASRESLPPSPDIAVMVHGHALTSPTFAAYWTLATTTLNHALGPPMPAEIHFQRSQAWKQIRWPNRELAELDAAIVCDPKHIAARLRRAARHLEALRMPAALADYNAVLEAKPDCRDALILRAEWFARKLQWTESARDLERVCNLYPADNSARVERAMAWIHTAREKEAADELSDMQRAYWYDSKYSGIWLKALARAGEKGRLETAVRYATSHSFDSGDHENTIAWSLVTGPSKTRRPDLALPIIEKAIDLRPGNYVYLNTLGQVLSSLKRDNDAIAAIEKRMRMTKSGPTAFDAVILAICHARQGKKVEAKKEIDFAKRYRDRRMQTRSPMDLADLNLLIAEAEQLLASTTPSTNSQPKKS